RRMAHGADRTLVKGDGRILRLLRMTHRPIATLRKVRRAVFVNETELARLQMKIAGARVPDIEARRAFLRSQNGERIGTAFLRDGDFDAGGFLERRGERFTPRQWDRA